MNTEPRARTITLKLHQVIALVSFLAIVGPAIWYTGRGWERITALQSAFDTHNAEAQAYKELITRDDVILRGLVSNQEAMLRQISDMRHDLDLLMGSLSDRERRRAEQSR